MKRSRKESKVNKKFIFLAIGLAIVLIGSVLATIIPPPTPKDDKKDKEDVRESYVIESNYIKEYKLPIDAEPVAINVKDGFVWFAGSKDRSIFRFDPTNQEFKSYRIPGNLSSTTISTWSLEFDEDNNIWFTDFVANSIWRFYTNEERFERYIVPSTSDFGTAGVINLVFANNRIWFSEIYAKKIGILDPNSVKNNSSEGISELEISSELETLGPLATDGKYVWFTALTYQLKGELYRLDINTLEIQKYELPDGLSSPVGIAIDNNRLWINDHGTSSISIFDALLNKFSSIVTSLPIKETSPWLYNQCVNNTNVEMCGGLPSSLPYWSKIIDDKLWFNEHYGNTIGILDIDDYILLEYIIPTMNPNYAECSNYEPCGIANALHLDVENDKAWFSEWSENKIGVLEYKSLPISLRIDNEITLIRGSNTQISIRVEAEKALEVEMRISGNTSPLGRLINMSAKFDERIIKFDGKDSKEVTLNILTEPTLKPGDYMLTITAKISDAMYSKIVKARVI